MIPHLSTPRGRKSRRGYTMLEILLSAAVVASFLVIAGLLFMNTSGKSRIQETFAEIQSIATGVRSLYSNQQGYGGLTVSTAITNQIIDNKWVNGARNGAVNPWGGGLNVVGNNNRTFSITLDAIPQADCATVALMNADGAGAFLQGMTINGTNVALPPTPTTATNACANGQANTIIWILR